MGISPKLLGQDEQLVHHMRTHIKRLFLPIIGCMLLLAGLIAGLIYMPTGWDPWGRGALGVVFVLGLIAIGLMPYLRWATTTFTITTRRIITRQGILNKTGHDIPLVGISDVSYERSLGDRIFGCGTLVLQTSADDPLRLDDIPRVESVHVELSELLFKSLGGMNPRQHL